MDIYCCMDVQPCNVTEYPSIYMSLYGNVCVLNLQELDHQSQTIAGLEIQLQKLTSDKNQIDKKLKLENERVQEHSDQLTHVIKH